MTGRDPEKLLRQEALRFPVVAELLDRIAYLTDAEIDAAPVPLPWYRVALKQLRARESFKATVDDMKDRMDGGHTAFRHGVNPSIKGRQAVYGGPDTWIKMFNSELQLKYGTLLFFPVSGGVWVDCSFGPRAQVSFLQQYCREGIDTNLDAYKSAFNSRLVGSHPDAPMTVNLHTTSSTPQHISHLAALGVKIS